jgi:hypothetical protein
MYTVKIKGPGTIVFRGKQARLPATFHKVPLKELKALKLACLSTNSDYEILEEEGDRIASVAEKAKTAEINIDEIDIDDTDTKIEDLFDSDDTLGNLLKSIEKE